MKKNNEDKNIFEDKIKQLNEEINKKIVKSKKL